MRLGEFGGESLGLSGEFAEIAKHKTRILNGLAKFHTIDSVISGMSMEFALAAVSVSANIAEGCSRYSNKDKKRFFEIGYGSNMEVLNHIIIAESIGFCTTTESESVRTKTLEISKMISGYVRSLNSKPSSPSQGSTPLNPPL